MQLYYDMVYLPQKSRSNVDNYIFSELRFVGQISRFMATEGLRNSTHV